MTKSDNGVLLKIFLGCLLAHIAIMPFFGFIIPERITKPHYQKVYLYQESKSRIVNRPAIRTNPQLPVTKPVSKQKIGIPAVEQGYRENLVAVGLPKTPLLTVENQDNISWELPIPKIQPVTIETVPSGYTSQPVTQPGEKTSYGDFEITGPGGSRLILSKVLPEYPLWAEKQNIEANVRIKIWVDRSGTVVSTSVVETSGHRKLDIIAEQALRKWRFSTIDQDINVWAIVTLKFRLQ